jgi:hypothetical protein
MKKKNGNDNLLTTAAIGTGTGIIYDDGNRDRIDNRYRTGTH